MSAGSLLMTKAVHAGNPHCAALQSRA